MIQALHMMIQVIRMKGFVLHFRNQNKAIRLPSVGSGIRSLRVLIMHYGLRTLFAALFLMGLIVGALSGRSFDKTIVERLDFLFVTNIEARLQMSAFSIFSSCFVSYFLFIFLLFLFALSAWGFAAVPLLSVAKGFSVGLSSAFIFSAYQMAGIGFYILVILPGVVLFLFNLVRYSQESMRLSLCWMRMSIFGCERAPMRDGAVKLFIQKSVHAFLRSCACAVADMLLWVLFIGYFHFT